MKGKNIANLPAAGAMNLTDGVLVLQDGKAVYMPLQDLLGYVASANVQTDPTLQQEGMAADAAATGAAIKAARDYIDEILGGAW